MEWMVDGQWILDRDCLLLASEWSLDSHLTFTFLSILMRTVPVGSLSGGDWVRVVLLKFYSYCYNKQSTCGYSITRYRPHRAVNVCIWMHLDDVLEYLSNKKECKLKCT